MDVVGWLEIIAPVMVALLAVWLGYRYQLVSLDRETRKGAYLDAIAALLHLRDLIELAEQVNFASWLLAFQARQSKISSGEGTSLDPIAKSLAQWVVRSREIASRLGLNVDWGVVSDYDSLDWGTDLIRMRSLLFGAFLREEELVRERFNLAIVHAASVTRLGIFWVVFRKKSESQRRTLAALHRAHDELEGILRVVSAVSTDPHPVDWTRIGGVLDAVVTASFTDIGSLGHVSVGLRPDHERIPWPSEILDSELNERRRRSAS